MKNKILLSHQMIAVNVQKELESEEKASQQSVGTVLSNLECAINTTVSEPYWRLGFGVPPALYA